MIKLSTRWFKRFLTPEVSKDAEGALQIILKDKDGIHIGTSTTNNTLQKSHGLVSVDKTSLMESMPLGEKTQKLHGLGLGSYMHKTLKYHLKEDGVKLFSSDITGSTTEQAAKVWERNGAKPFDGEIVKKVKTKQGDFVYRYKPKYVVDLEKTSAYIPGVTEAVGRVFTNLVEPFSYTGHFTKLKNILKEPKAAIGSIIKDKPAYNTLSSDKKDLYKVKDQLLDRDAILRYKFHLSERNPPATIVHDGKGTFNIKGDSWMRDDVVMNYISNHPPKNALMGSYDLASNRKGIVARDIWDWKTHPGENKLDPTNVVRNLVDKVTKKAVIKGDFKPTGLSEKTLESAIEKAKESSTQLRNKREWSKARKYDNIHQKLFLELRFKQKIRKDSIKRLGGEFIHKRVPDNTELTAYSSYMSPKLKNDASKIRPDDILIKHALFLDLAVKMRDGRIGLIPVPEEDPNKLKVNGKKTILNQIKHIKNEQV